MTKFISTIEIRERIKDIGVLGGSEEELNKLKTLLEKREPLPY